GLLGANRREATAAAGVGADVPNVRAREPLLDGAMLRLDILNREISRPSKRDVMCGSDVEHEAHGRRLPKLSAPVLRSVVSSAAAVPSLAASPNAARHGGAPLLPRAG